MIGSHRATIQKKNRVADGQGGWIIEWIDLKDVWLTVKPLSSKERLAYQRLDEEVSHRVTMRYDPTIKSNYRFKFKNRILEIKGKPININEENRILEMNCIETFLQEV